VPSGQVTCWVRTARHARHPGFEDSVSDHAADVWARRRQPALEARRVHLRDRRPARSRLGSNATGGSESAPPRDAHHPRRGLGPRPTDLISTSQYGSRCARGGRSCAGARLQRQARQATADSLTARRCGPLRRVGVAMALMHARPPGGTVACWATNGARNAGSTLRDTRSRPVAVRAVTNDNRSSRLPDLRAPAATNTVSDGARTTRSSAVAPTALEATPAAVMAANLTQITGTAQQPPAPTAGAQCALRSRAVVWAVPR